MNNREETRELILAIRGGTGGKCDFCGFDKPDYELHPEEGGEWICNNCIKRIGYGPESKAC